MGKPIKTGSNNSSSHLKNAINYILNPEKTQGLVECHACVPELAYEQMLLTKERFGKMDMRQAYHWKMSFSPNEVSPEVALEVARLWTEQYLGGKYETLMAAHSDKQHIHVHILFNSVSLVDGKKFRYEDNDFEYKMLPLLNRLCYERGLSTIFMGEGVKKNLTYIEWMERKKGHKTWRSMICADMDEAISKAYNLGSFVVNMENMGYDVR